MFPFDKVIIVCWIVFWIYWLVSAFGSKRNSKPIVGRFIRIRIVIFFIAVILFRLFNSDTIKNPLANNNDALRIIGLIIFLVGLLLAVWARLYLGKNWGMPMSEKQSPELVTSGPYNYIRHPIYSGILLGIIGSAITISVTWLLVFIIAAVYFIYSAVMEEKLMTRQFPKVYPEYARRTKMLIPFIL